MDRKLRALESTKLTALDTPSQVTQLRGRANALILWAYADFGQVKFGGEGEEVHRLEEIKAEQPEDNGLALGDNNRCNNTALRKATRRVSQLYDTLLAPTGLRQTQRSILMHVARLGNPTMRQLAASLVLDRSALGHNLRPLERDGYIALDVDPGDKRNRLAKLTKRGERKLRETAVLWQAAQERFESKFGIECAKALRDVLAMIAAEDFDEVLDTPPALPRKAKRRRSPPTA